MGVAARSIPVGLAQRGGLGRGGGGYADSGRSRFGYSTPSPPPADITHVIQVKALSVCAGAGGLSLPTTRKAAAVSYVCNCALRRPTLSENAIPIYSRYI